MALQHLQEEVELNLTDQKYAQGSGWGLYASSDISARDRIISIQEPFVTALDITRLKDTCYFCHGYKTATSQDPGYSTSEGNWKLKICTGCHVVRYCSKHCQVQSWKTVHKQECHIFARLHPNILPNNVRAITQLLMLRKANRLAAVRWQDFMKLESHMAEWVLRDGEVWENISLMARATQEYSGTDLKEDALQHIFGKLLVNCFTMVSPCYDPLGLVLHPLAALLNHSCNCNAVVRFDFSTWCHTFSIRALRPIARGEQVVISYIDATNPYQMRQKELQERYFFTCECSTCRKELINKEGIIYQPTSNDHLLVEQRAFELLAQARKDTSISAPIQKLQYGIHILKKTNSWPLHRQPLAALRQQLIVSLMAADQIHLAFVHAWIQYRSIDPEIMPEEHHPIRLVHQWLAIVLLKRIEWAQHCTTDLPVQKYSLLRRSINFRTILHYLLHHLYDRVKNDPGDGTFAHMVGDLYSQDFDGGRLSQRQLITGAEFLTEAEKLRACTTEILETELVWREKTT